MKRRKHTVAMEVTFNREVTAKEAARALQMFLERMPEETRRFELENLALQKFEAKEFQRAVAHLTAQNHSEARRKLTAIRRLLSA